VAAGISTAISAVVLITSARRRDKIIVRVGAAVLFFAALLIAVGLGWLPTYGEDEIGPA